MTKSTLLKPTLTGLFITLILFLHPLAADRFQFGANFGMGFSQGQFRQNIDTDIIFPTASLFFALKIKDTPLYLISQIGGKRYGYESNGYSDYYTQYLILDCMAGLRAQLKVTRKALVYAEFMYGLHIMDTSYVSKYSDSEDHPDSMEHINSDLSTGYTLGAGFFWRLGNKLVESSKGSRHEQFYAGISLEYLHGNKTNYLSEEDWVLHSSSVNLLSVQVGFFWRF